MAKSAPQKRDKNGVLRDEKGRVVKGSGAINPGGRPKAVQSVVDLAREHTEDAVRTLVEIALNKRATDSARVSAAAHLLDRGWGKPAQSLEHTGKDGADLSVTVKVEHAGGDSLAE
jgi:hypothetical protein